MSPDRTRGSDAPPSFTPATVPALDSNRSRPIPRANTGSALLNLFANVTTRAMQLERRIDPFYRPAFDALFREPLGRLVTALINAQRTNEGYQIAEERIQPDELAHLDAIITTFEKQMAGLWKPGGYERGGNTKTHGVLRGEFIVHDNLPPNLKVGLYAQPRSYRAWVRFSGPGPYVTPDIDDVGFMSIGVKLMGVPGPKLMDDEHATLDLLGVCTPTFPTADTASNVDLQAASLQNAAILHFVNRWTHFLDLLMQGLWTRTQSSPLEAAYFSCVPYLMGNGQAMMFSFWPKVATRSRIPRVPLRPPDDYLRQNMAAALAEQDVEFDVRVQLQADPHLMPIENASVLWPERLSPRVSVATLRLPRQAFDSPAQLAFARQLVLNPWHTIAEHRPLGNQSRARKEMYWRLSQLRQRMNGVQHVEPTGDEVFE